MICNSYSFNITQSGHDGTDQILYANLSSIPENNVFIVTSMDLAASYTGGTGCTYQLGYATTNSSFNFIFNANDNPMNPLETFHFDSSVSGLKFNPSDYLYILTNMSDGNSITITLTGYFLSNNHPYVSKCVQNGISTPQTITFGNFLELDLPSTQRLNLKNIYAKCTDESGIKKISLYVSYPSSTNKYLINTTTLTGSGVSISTLIGVGNLLTPGVKYYFTTATLDALEVYYSYFGVEVE